MPTPFVGNSLTRYVYIFKKKGGKKKLSDIFILWEEFMYGQAFSQAWAKRY